jgi:hypothetical protein
MVFDKRSRNLNLIAKYTIANPSSIPHSARSEGLKKAGRKEEV